MVQVQEEIDKVQQILDMQNQGNSSEGSQSQRTRKFERKSQQSQPKKGFISRSKGQQYDQEGKDKHQKLINPPSPQGRHEGDISTNRSQPQPIQVLKDPSSSNSSDPPELLGSEMELLNCGCTRCHREGQNNISTDICAKDRILQLCNQLNQLKTQVKELSLIKEGLVAGEELQSKEVNLEERVKAKNEIIKRLKDTLIDMINKIRKFFFKEDPIQKEVTEEQLEYFCQATANKCVQNLIKAFEQLNNKSKSSEDETVNIVITDFPSETQMPENIRNELQGSRKKIEQMEKQIKLKKGELELCLELQVNYHQSLITKDDKIKEYEQKERQWTNFIEQKNQSIRSLTNQIQHKTANLSEKDKAFVTLQREYTANLSEKDEKFVTLQRDYNFLLDQKEKLEEECQIKTETIQELQSTNKDLQEKYFNALQTIKEKQQQIEGHKSSAINNLSLWQTQKTTHERLTQDQLQAKQSELQHLKATLQKIKQQNIQFKQTFTHSLEELKNKSESDLNEQIQQRQQEMEEASTRYENTIKTIRETVNSEIESHKQFFQAKIKIMKDDHMGQLTREQNLNSQLSKNNQQLQATIQQLETKICQFIKQHDNMLKFYNTSFGNFITTQRTKSLDAQNDHQNNYATLIQTILTLEEENGTMKNNIDLLMKDYLDTLLLSRTSALQIQELSLLNVQLTAEKQQLVSSHNERTHLLQKKIQQIELAYNKSYNQMCQIQQNHYKQAVEAQTTVLNARITLLENQLKCQSQISTESARLASCQQSFNEMEIGELKGQLAAEKERHQRTARKYKNHKEELMDQVSRYEQTADDFHNQKIALEINLKQYETLVEGINKTVSNFLGQVGSQPLQVLLSAASSSFEQNIDSLYRLTNTFSIFYEQVTVRAISVENKNSQLQNQIDSLSLQNSELKSSAQMNGQDLTLKVKEVETKLKIVEKQLQQTNTDRQNLKATVATAQRQLKQLKLKDKQSEKTIFSLNSKIEQFASSNSKQSNRANEILSQKDGKIMQLTTKLTQFEAQKKQLSNQLESITRENSKLKNEAFALKEEERKSVSLKKNQQNKIRESEILQDQYLTQKLKTQQQNEKLQRKSQQYEKQIADLKRKILENETQMQSNRNTFESTISKREHLSQIQQFQTIVQQQKMKIQKLERSSQSMITESVYNRKEDEMQQIIDKLQRQKAILQEKYREAQIGFKKEKESPVSLARVNSQKILKSFSPEESAFLNMFSSRTLLDLPQHQAKKELLIKTILDRTGKELKETSLSFSYSLKNRTFHTSITKAVLTNDESYVFLFNSKGKDNSSNLFAITIYKTGQKNVPILAVLTLLSKEGTFQKRRDCSSTTLPISFDYSGTEVTFGATYKIKSGDTKLRTQLQSKYFDMPSPFVVFDKQSKEVQLQNFQIHKIVLE